MPTKKTTEKEEKEAAKPKPAKKAAKKVARKAGKASKSTKTKSKAGAEGLDSIQKLRIRVRAYEHKLLDASVKQIMDTAHRYDSKVLGPVPLPTEISKYTVNRSSFVHKDAREQFEMRVHKRLIDIIEPAPKVIEALTNLSLPSGVNIEVKML